MTNFSGFNVWIGTNTFGCILSMISAKSAGFPVVTLFDESAADDEEEIRENADWYLETISDWEIE